MCVFDLDAHRSCGLFVTKVHDLGFVGLQICSLFFPVEYVNFDFIVTNWCTGFRFSSLSGINCGLAFLVSVNKVSVLLTNGNG